MYCQTYQLPVGPSILIYSYSYQICVQWWRFVILTSILVYLRLTHTHNHFTAVFLGLPSWAGARRRNLLNFMVQGEITEANTLTIRLGAIPCGLISDPAPSFPHFCAGCPSCRNRPNLSWLGTGTKYAGLHTQWLGCLGHDTELGHSYYGMLIRSHVWSVEWWIFQWPWMTFEVHFSHCSDACRCWIFSGRSLAVQLIARVRRCCRNTSVFYREMVSAMRHWSPSWKVWTGPAGALRTWCLAVEVLSCRRLIVILRSVPLSAALPSSTAHQWVLYWRLTSFAEPKISDFSLRPNLELEWLKPDFRLSSD